MPLTPRRRAPNFISVVSNIKLQTMPSTRKRPWRRRGGSARISLMSNNSIESNLQLADVEEEFLHAAEFGDIPTVQEIVNRNTNLNVDCIDALGRTALRLAVKNEHLEVVEILLDRSSGRHIYEAVLQAISAGHVQIAETILKHRRYLEMWKERKRLGDDDHFFTTASEESQFSPDITPLILAAQKNQYEIVQLLLLRGELIQQPHKFHCKCQECTNKMEFDKLRSAKYRLNAYRGLASEAYISLSSKDPILTAFELGAELKNLSQIEKYFKKEYKDLAEQLSEYVVRLLDRVRTQEELEVVLNKTGKPKVNKYESLARFKLALHYRQKKFVAHPSCQQRLVSTWYLGMENLERSNWPRRILMFFLFVFSYPFLVVIHLFSPSQKCVKSLHYPCVKFICHMLSFLIFLILIVVSTAESSRTVSNTRTLRTEYVDIHLKYLMFKNYTNSFVFGEDFPIRQELPTVTQYMISLWVLGFAWAECTQLFHEGFLRYVKSWYNLMDIALLCVYCASFTLRYVIMFKILTSANYLRDVVLPTRSVEEEIQTRNSLYWMNADRFYWEPYDPINMSEGLFAIANILSFSRISYLLPANEILGPLQISLGRMITDILKFLVLFMLVLGAFMVGLFNLFWYYSVRKSVEVTPHNFTSSAEVNFGDVLATFRTVFWSVFGRGDTDVVKLGDFDNRFTEDIGYIIYGLYNIAMVIVLLNMLIAMMARSFQNITEDADAEWKFSRSMLYMDYIGEGAALPVPLNVIGAPSDLIRALLRCFCGNSDSEEDEIEQDLTQPNVITNHHYQNGNMGNGSSPIEATSIEVFETDMKPGAIDRRKSLGMVEEPGIKKSYQRVIQTIIQRYIFDMQREAEITEDDFEEIKQDISSFRYEILNQMKLREATQNEITLAIKNIAEELKQMNRDQCLRPHHRLFNRGGSVKENMSTTLERMRKEECRDKKSPEQNEKK